MAALAGTSLEGVALAPDQTVSHADVGLDRVAFLNAVIGEFAATIEQIVGPDEASGYISAVAQNVADWLNFTYHRALGPDDFSVERIAHVLADLRTRVDGGYIVRSVSADKIVVANDPCLFAPRIKSRRALCTMTSTVFGRIAAENTGYARIEHVQANPEGDGGCAIHIHFRHSNVRQPGEREFYRTDTLDFG